MARMAAVAIMSACVIRCTDPDPVSVSIKAAVDAGAHTRVVLADIAPFAWQRVCIFGPYTAANDIETVVGLAGAAAHAFDINSNDRIDVLMFVRDERVVSSIAHPRRLGDFGPGVVGRCFSRPDAVFVVTEGRVLRAAR